MKFCFSLIAFLFFTTLASAQAEDSVFVYDTAVVDQEYYDYEEEEDTEYSSSTYTQNPNELNPSKKELEKQYTEKKFSKSEWKKIVGETNYTEDPIAEEEEEDKPEKPMPPPSAAWNPALLKIIGYALILILIGVVIFFLLRSALRDDGLVQRSANGETLLYENHIDEITESDLDRMLREALAKSDFRAAIRLYYIKLLKHLNTTGYIAWKKDKTNRDYATEVSGSPFTREFRKLVTAYEIIWYGDRTPSAEEFQKLQASFNDLQRQARPTT